LCRPSTATNTTAKTRLPRNTLNGTAKNGVLFRLFYLLSFRGAPKNGVISRRAEIHISTSIMRDLEVRTREGLKLKKIMTSAQRAEDVEFKKENLLCRSRYDGFKEVAVDFLVRNALRLIAVAELADVGAGRDPPTSGLLHGGGRLNTNENA
jgi:hypothetical protein